MVTTINYMEIEEKTEKLTRKAILQIEQERLALADQVERAVTRLRKMIMMSNGLRLRLEHVRIAREAYRKGELVEPNDLYLARRKLVELVLLSPRKARVDRELIGYRRSKLDDEMGQVTRAYVEDACEDFKGGDRVEQGVDEEDGLSSDIGSDVDSANEDDDFDDCVSNEKEIS
ncbi:plant organelle RNA recognition domain protein [Medicago truncatula]|uniref:Plant organelle RNA recognition domain protein n=1 Tax=Medicago truncatula TaxID=3880 RepID=A0A072U7G5_MEDTR|nr:plant organelle RNA recognition domain protein [Medicago truncatula]